MRKAILFIAMSLDGYIADRNGGVEWLSGHGDPEEDIDSWSEFVKNVDTVIMGHNTYTQIVTELSPDEWVYSGLKSFVITHDCVERSEKEDITFTSEAPEELLRRLLKKEGKDIWICGGSKIIAPLISEDLIDEYHISVIPTILGGGLRLFPEAGRELKLKLIRQRNYNGIVELVYTGRNSKD